MCNVVDTGQEYIVNIINAEKDRGPMFTESFMATTLCTDRCRRHDGRSYHAANHAIPRASEHKLKPGYDFVAVNFSPSEDPDGKDQDGVQLTVRIPSHVEFQISEVLRYGVWVGKCKMEYRRTRVHDIAEVLPLDASISRFFPDPCAVSVKWDDDIPIITRKIQGFDAKEYRENAMDSP